MQGAHEFARSRKRFRCRERPSHDVGHVHPDRRLVDVNVDAHRRPRRRAFHTRYGHGRAVARQDRFKRREPVQLSEDRALDGQIFGNDFHDKISLSKCKGEILMNLDRPGVPLPIFDRKRRPLACHPHRLAHLDLHALKCGAVGIEAGDAVTVCGCLDRDLRSKRTQAYDGNVANVH